MPQGERWPVANVSVAEPSFFTRRIVPPRLVATKTWSAVTVSEKGESSDVAISLARHTPLSQAPPRQS